MSATRIADTAAGAARLNGDYAIARRQRSAASNAPLSLRRRLKIEFLRLARSCGLFALARRWNSKAVRIFCYHGAWIGEETYCGDSLFITAATFEERLRTVERLGYPVIPLERAVAGLRGYEDLPRDSTVITIDDGWYGVFLHMLPALRQRSMPTTLFCDTANFLSGDPVPHVMTRYLARLRPDRRDETVTRLIKQGVDLEETREARLEAALSLARELDFDPDAILRERTFAYMSRDELRSAADDGLDVQLHTHSHSLGDMSLSRMRAEIDQNRKTLSDVLGRKPESFRHFCYPSGKYTKTLAALLEQDGIASSATVEPGLARRGSHRQLLPRFVDGDNVLPIEFEAELCGFASNVRSLTSAARAVVAMVRR